MKDRRRSSDAEHFLTTIQERLDQDGVIISTVTGTSMMPTLRSEKDRVIIEVPKGRLQKDDIALYKRWDGAYVLHRIVEVHETEYEIRGDNTYQSEFVPFEQVCGVVTHFVRNGRVIDVTDAAYRRYVAALKRLYWFRKGIWKARRTVKAFLRL